jgi:hypothetical protein
VFRQQTSIEFRGGDDLRRQWDAALSAQETEIRNFVRTAKEHGLGSVAGMMLRIVPQLYDDRKITAGPSPALTPREFVLE